MILVLSWTFLRCRYRLTHIGGMALGLMSVVVLVWVDIDDGKGGVSSGGKLFPIKYIAVVNCMQNEIANDENAKH